MNTKACVSQAASILASATAIAGGTLYWNPTTTPGAAGDAEWSTAAAAWSESAAGTSAPVVWQDIWQDWYNAVFATPGASVVTVPGYLHVNSLSFLGGSYVFPTTQELAPYGDMLVVDSNVTISNRISFQASNLKMAFTNSTFRYKGNGNPFTTGWGNSGSSIEIVNTTGEHGGMYFDCMTEGLKIGDVASDCSLLVDGGGVSGGAIVTNMHYNRTGLHIGSPVWDGTGSPSRNTAVIRNGAEVWDNLTVNNAGNEVGKGNGSNSNRLDIIGGEGFVSKLVKGYPGAIGNGAATGNVVRVDGRGFAGSAMWQSSQNGAALYVGKNGAFGSRLEIVDGGVVEGAAVYLGPFSCSNEVHVSGAGSVLRGAEGSSALEIGHTSEWGRDPGYSEGNVLYIEDGGLVEKFYKWNTAIGGNEDGPTTGTTVGNGIVVSGGSSYIGGNNTYIGRIKGEGSRADGNFLHVKGAGSSWDNKYNLDIYVAYAIEGATADGNELVIEDGGYVKVRTVHVGDGSTTTVPGGVSGNRVVVRGNGFLEICDSGGGGWSELDVGISGDSDESPVAVGNEVIAERGGVISGRHFKTLSGGGNAIRFRDGGVLLLFTNGDQDTEISPYEPGSISFANSVIGIRRQYGFDDVHFFENSAVSERENGLKALAVSGHNGLRFDNTYNNQGSSAPQSYVFEETDNPRHFAWLEMVNGETTYNEKANTDGEMLTIGETGSMLCSNTTATVNIAAALNGPLRIVDSTVTFKKDVTLGAGFSLAIGGDLEEGRTVIVSEVADLDFGNVSLPENWKLKQKVEDGAYVYSLHYSVPSFMLMLF